MIEDTEVIEDGFDGDRYFGIDLADVRDVRKKAELGYMSMSLYPPPPGAFWGEFNNRRIREDWVAGLMEDYEKRIDNCSDLTAIDVVVKCEWIKNFADRKKTAEGSKIHLLPEMEFTEEGMKAINPRNLWILSGNHRRESLTRYLDKLLAEVKAINLKIKEVRDSAGSKALSADKQKSVDDAEATVRKKEEIIEKSKKWAVRLYDRGE